jgi:hypothetical protein
MNHPTHPSGATHGRIKTRLMASVLAAVLAPVFAFGAAYTGGISEADAAEKANCRVHAVLASKEGDGKLPKDLKFLEKTLQADEFAVYKSFHLLEKKDLKLKLEKPSEVTFKSGHKMGLTLMAIEEDKLKYHLSLSGRDGEKILVDTDYSIEDHGLIMTGVGEYKAGEVSGKLFLTIQCGRA